MMFGFSTGVSCVVSKKMTTSSAMLSHARCGTARLGLGSSTTATTNSSSSSSYSGRRALHQFSSLSDHLRVTPSTTTTTTTSRRHKSALPEPDYDSYYHHLNGNTNNSIPQHFEHRLPVLNGHSNKKSSHSITRKRKNQFVFHERETEQQQQVVGSISDILNARVYDVARETQLQEARNLSTHLQNHVYLKREDTQDVFSFKIRGAYNKMAHLTDAQLQAGVVCCSAGNHAQGVALSAARLGARAIIVMPLQTPEIKVNAVRTHGGPTVEVRLHGDNYDEAAAEAKRLQTEEQMTMIHPFDDRHVIAGQGTIGMEILKQRVSQPLDAIFVCCGGGGMLAGIASYVKRVRPSVKVIGVEAEDAAGMTASLQAGRVVTLPEVGPFADGAAVKTVGAEPFRICQELVDDMITVNTDEICRAIKMSYNDARVVLEPAGALGVAGLSKYVQEQEIQGQTLAAVTSGANMDFDKLGFIWSRCQADKPTQ